MKLVFLLEEPSTKYLLDELLPRILPEGVLFQTILQDQDTKNCYELKKALLTLCEGSERRVLVRIACQEMEAWYFGDMEALALAYDNPKLRKISAQRKYRVPDEIQSPKEELYRLIPEHQQIAGAKRVAPHMDIDRNTSESFRQFVSGILRFVKTDT